MFLFLFLFLLEETSFLFQMEYGSTKRLESTNYRFDFVFAGLGAVEPRCKMSNAN